MKTIAFLMVAGLISTSAYGKEEKARPCKELKAACESAGFHKGGKSEGKGLGADCMKKLLAGEAVAGVSAKADVVSACKANKEKRAAKKADRKGKGADG